MNNLIAYIFAYYTFIDIQKSVPINEQKMVPIFLKSKPMFYTRLFITNIQNNLLVPGAVYFFLGLGMVLKLVHPIILILAIMMHVSVICLQYSHIYNYAKYFIYAIPAICFLFNRLDFIMLTTFMIIVLHMRFMLQFKLKLYQKTNFALPLTRLTNKKYVLFILLACFGLVLLVFVSQYNNQKIPIEEILLVMAIYMLAVLEGQVIGNKVLVLRMKSRFNLIRSKSEKITFDFLLPIHKLMTSSVLICLFMVTITLGIVTKNYLLYLPLFIGGILLFLYTIDYLTQCLLLEQSIAYENKIVQFIITTLVQMPVYMYGGFYMLDKYIFSIHMASKQLESDFSNVLGSSKIISLIIYSVLISFFIWRLLQAFKVNKRIKNDHKPQLSSANEKI